MSPRHAFSTPWALAGGNRHPLNRIAPLALLVLFLSMAVASGATAQGPGSMVLRVYSDGYVHVDQASSVNPKAASVKVPLLSPAVYDLVATDQNGSPLSFGIASGGTNLTVYTLGASEVALSYDTSGLTSKNGTVWTLEFASAYNTTVFLPQLSTLSYVSGTPYTINQTDGSPVLTLSQGAWKVSYGVPLGSVTGTRTATGGGGPVTSFGLTPIELGAGGAAAAAAAVGLVIWLWRRRTVAPSSGDLRPDDIQVLGFIRERGGRVAEPEIRMRFALPKTSAWRQIKRLERLGYVKVTKIGSQNQIELLKEKEEGG